MEKFDKINILLSIIMLILAGVFYFLYFNSSELTLETEVKYEKGYRVIFNFNQPVVKKSFEKNFEIKPETKGKITWENTKKAIYHPYYLEYNKTHTVFLKDVKSYLLTNIKEHKFNFRVKPPSSIPLSKNSGPQKLPDQDKNVFIRPNGEKVILEKPRIRDGKSIEIDISEQILSLYKNGKIINAYEVSTGRYDMPTPPGEFKVLRKEENHWSYNYRLYMPYSLQFTRAGHYIHELPYWPGGYREGQNHLGARVSHGCVRLGIGPAEAVYNFAETGTPIIIHE